MTRNHEMGQARRLARLAAVTVILAVLGVSQASAQIPAPGVGTTRHWLAGWSPSPVEAVGSDVYDSMAFPGGRALDQSVRAAVVVTAPGEWVRLRLSNRYGEATLRIGHVQLAQASSGPALVAGSSRSLSFGGRRGTAIPPGAESVSDPLRFSVEAGEQLAISVHVLGGGGLTFHKQASGLSYVAPSQSGDQTGDESGAAYTRTAPSWFWIAGLDADSPWAGAVAALGDSITDGYLLLPDQQETWPAVLATRLGAAPPPLRRAVVNAGISGNELTGSVWPEYGPSAVSRLDADVLKLAGVTNLIVFEGTNDLAHGATTLQVVTALRRIIVEARARGIRVFGATITPRNDRSWDELTMEPVRQAVNRWIRTSRAFAAVFDFDELLRDPSNPHQLAPAYDADGLHPNPLGLRAIADSVDLVTFA